jgi:hypothetical protein
MDFKFKLNQRVFIEENGKIDFTFSAYIVGSLNMMGKKFYLLDFEYSDIIMANDILKTIAYPESFLLSVEEAKEKYFALKNEVRLQFSEIFENQTEPKKIKFL